MILVIDASNIRAGGGQIHLIELLNNVHPNEYGFEQVVVCAPKCTLTKMTETSWIRKYEHPLINGNYAQQWKWRMFLLPKLVLGLNAFLFIPGAIKPPFKWRYATMCQNLLPLEYQELFRYKLSVTTLRLLVLRYLNLRAYKHASGTIFLTSYCSHVVASIGRKVGNFKVIPHGLNRIYFQPTQFLEYQKCDGQYFELLYVSILDVYKHQDKVISAILNLNRMGYKVRLTLVGPAYPPSKRKIEKMLDSSKQARNLISYLGMISYETLSKMYCGYHAFIFASTCETFGMIVTEAMSMGMPILCTNKSSLRETVQDAALYFDPTKVSSIEGAIIAFVENDGLRRDLSERALRRSEEFSWAKCARETFTFLADTARKSGF
jgi:glycosyltransferase involved in cell wall biosynthesis